MMQLQQEPQPIPTGARELDSAQVRQGLDLCAPSSMSNRMQAASSKGVYPWGRLLSGAKGNCGEELREKLQQPTVAELGG